MLVFVEFSNPLGDYCQVNTLGFGMESVPLAGGSGRSAHIQGVHFTKDRDSLSARLFEHCAGGTNFTRVDVEYYRDEDSARVCLYRMTDVTIASFNSTAKGEESIALSYKALKGTYFK